MRSFLAGLRRLIVPWGARPTDSAVIIDGAPDPILIASGQEAAIIFQYSPDGVVRRGFVLSVESSAGTNGELHLFQTDFVAPLFDQQLADFVAAENGSGSIRFGNVMNDGSFGVQWNAAGDLTGANFPPPTATTEGPTARVLESTASATFVNFSGNPSFTYSKVFGTTAGTTLIVLWSATVFFSANTAGVEFAVRIDGTDYVVAKLAPTTLTGIRMQVSGSTQIGGLSAGNKTITPRWRRIGVGNAQVDTADVWCCTVFEAFNA